MAEYLQTSDNTADVRYKEKIKLIDNFDPYTMDRGLFSPDSRHFPNIGYSDVVNYLVFEKSAYTLEDVKVYKELEAYKLFKCDRVKSVVVTNVAGTGLCLIVGRVSPSQRHSQKSLIPWIVSTPKGEVKCAHCTCVDGSEEKCTHVAALLFFVQDAVHNRPAGRPPKYTIPSTDDVKYYAEVKDIDFSAPSRKRKGKKSERKQPVIETPKVEPLSEKELKKLLKDLHDAGCNSAILTMYDPSYYL